MADRSKEISQPSLREGPPAGRDRSGAYAAALVAALVLALAVRFLNYKGVFHGADVYLFGTDSYAHMRRIWLGVVHYPIVPFYDPYVNFPTGAISLWPPGFDLLLATLGRVASPGAPLLRTVEATSALAIPFLGLISIVFVARIARALEGPAAGILAALVLAALPEHVLLTRLGNVDHHVVELAFLAALASIWIGAALRPAAAPRAAVRAGLLLALAFAFWSGAQLYALLLPAGFVAGCAADAWAGWHDATLARAQRRFLLIASLAMIPVVWMSPYGRQGLFTFMGVSWLHPLFILACLAGLGSAHWALGHVSTLPAERRRRLLLASPVALFLLAGALFAAPRIFPLLGEMTDFVRARDPQARFTAEVMPITAFPAAYSLNQFSLGALLLFPAILLATMGARARARGGGDAAVPGAAASAPEDEPLLASARALTTLAAWLLCTALLACLQPVRLGGYFAIFLAAAIACAASALWRAGGPRRAAAGILLAASFLPGALGYRVSDRVETLDGNRWFTAIEEGLLWIRESTPPTSGWEDTRVRPEYSVLAQWSYGNWINHIARRPSVANPFALAPWHLRGFEDSIQFMIARREEDADRIARARLSRYVVATPLLYIYLPLAKAIDAPTLPYAVEAPDEVRYRPAFFHLMGNRLTFFDGARTITASDEAPALGHYRLVFEGSETTSGAYVPEGETVVTPSRVPFVKIFERVEGARLRGSTTPLERVEVSLVLRTNQGRRFVWSAATRADAAGRFELRVPYASRVAAGSGVTPGGPYAIRSAGREGQIAVTEAHVASGTALEIAWHARPSGEGGGAEPSDPTVDFR